MKEIKQQLQIETVQLVETILTKEISVPRNVVAVDISMHVTIAI